MPLSEDHIIFLVSAPRSGSTLLQRILSNSSEITTSNEPWILLPFLSVFKPELCRSSFNFQVASKGVLQFMKNTSDPELLKKELKKTILSVYGDLTFKDGQFFLDKTPRYYEILDLIREFFPRARILILKRSPSDVLRSILTRWKISDLTLLYDFHRDIMKAPFLIQEFIEQKNDDLLYTATYEELVDQPERQVKKIFEWLEMDFDPRFLEYSSNEEGIGWFGDKENIARLDRPQRIEKANLNLGWEPFIEGYGNYLGKEFLNRYGYGDEGGKEDEDFLEFLEYVEFRNRVKEEVHFREFQKIKKAKDIYRLFKIFS